MKTKDKSTIGDQMLTDHAYKVDKFIALGELLIVLILPLFKHLNLDIGCLFMCLLTEEDLFTTFFQRHHVTFLVSLLLGNLLSIVICVILFVYVIWASGNMIQD
ncbi:hypothetical protein [Lactobacillus sp. ESL0677]|uniref:hypothetical protein n=1 Tax=Lactobacillus sp. ESL0677 TaxID=2983208 RepID=UPI0023F61CBC|nr:hypothetical protein [Lactobacillus sp. ESL0677]WEV37121.1 hypothetical protein OZX76_00615 [Lactobacillus sp. ESL0677]